MTSLGTVLKNLESTKVTVRQEALNDIRLAFGKDTVVENFHLSDSDDGRVDYRPWLSVFGALFTMMRMEKQDYAKAVAKGDKPKPAVLKRLTDVASTIRWLTERAVKYLNRKVVQVILDHLIGGMMLKGELLTPVALDYIKALRCLLSHRPHLEHLGDDDWVGLVAMAFNVVLGDPPKANLADDADLVPRDDSFMYAEDSEREEEDDGDDELPRNLGKRKRNKREAPRTPQPSTSRQKPKPRSSRSARQISVSVEQVEFASVLSILLSFSGSPILSSSYPYLPSAILVRLERFLILYPADSSLLQDYLFSLSATLNHLALNRVHLVQQFARNTWEDLISLWGTKDKKIKEDLVIIIRCLLPYISADLGQRNTRDSYDQVAALWKLFGTLEAEADHRRGVEGLFLDSLRLEISGNVATDKSLQPFVAHTFRAGWNFDNGQAVSWVVLEMQADCAAKLYQLSESMHSSTTPIPFRGDKKRKLDNGISSIISNIIAESSNQARAYNLQVLLFFVDGHWYHVHQSLKQDIVTLLLQTVTSDDSTIQSWAFLNLAAITYAERFMSKAAARDFSPFSQSTQSQTQTGYEPDTWDTIWTHSIRRVNVPSTCRAACHAAYALILQRGGGQSTTLPSQLILSEVETLAADLDVQGPSYPYDSVCHFLSECIWIANQDVRLYRIHLEDKVIGWLIDHWKVAGIAKGRLMPQLLQDSIALLEAACGLSRRSYLFSRVLLPSSNIVSAVQREISQRNIRDFLLAAKLPAPQHHSSSSSISPPLNVTEHTPIEPHFVDLSPPQTRERKVSAFFLRTLELLVVEWENILDNQGRATADVSRHSLEFALAALAFESLLVHNGITANRHVVQCAGKLISIIVPLLNGSIWNSIEKTIVLYGLEPLVLLEDDGDSVHRITETLLSAGTSSGIKRCVFQELADRAQPPSSPIQLWRTSLLRTVWQMIDIQDCLKDVVTVLRTLLCRLIRGISDISTSRQTAEDGFEPIRVVAAQMNPGHIGDDAFARRLMVLCMQFVAAGPLLASVSGEQTRDKDVINAILACGTERPDSFLVGFSLLLGEAERKTFNLSAHLESLLHVLEDLLASYAYSRNEHIQQISAQLLHCTIDLWLNNPEVRQNMHELPRWFLHNLNRQKIKYATVRDAFVRYLDRLIQKQPRSLEWLQVEQDTASPLGHIPLQALNQDPDVRVRFSAAIVDARLFHAIPQLDVLPTELYRAICDSFPDLAERYEEMLTRFIALANIIIASSAVRRGPYWHLIETCFYAHQYSTHIEAILIAVSSSLGLLPSSLFEAYASQMGYSLLRSDNGDIARIPPNLIGFEDRRKSAAFTLSAFTPSYICSSNYDRFEAHCKMVQVLPEDIFHESFGDIIGAWATHWFYEHPKDDISTLESQLKEMPYNHDFNRNLQTHIDSTALAILRSVCDQEISPASAIHKAIQSQAGSKSIQAFTALVKYRLTDKYEIHEPNLPAFSIETVLDSLTWLFSKWSRKTTKTITYHILHNLFALVKRSPVVNEQLRLVNALAVWIALHPDDFNDVTLLRTLVRGATTLLLEYDLVHAAQSMLEWALHCYRNFKIRDSSLANNIIQICSICYNYSRLPHSDFAKLGASLVDWIDNLVLELSKTWFAASILRALPVWPYPPSSELAQLSKEDTPDSLRGILTETKLAFNKFGLVRRLCHHASQGNYPRHEFASSDFWCLKDCIPPVHECQDEDIDAFSLLLYLNSGDIGGISGEHQSNSFVLDHHRNPQRKTTNSHGLGLMHETIIQSLFQLFNSLDTETVSLAYETLRSITSVSDDFQLPSGANEQTTELTYLRAFPRKAKTRPSCDLRETLLSDVSLDSAASFDQWISMISSQLSDCLAKHDSFFAQLHTILHSNATIATEILPILVHGALLSELKNGASTTLEYCKLLSQYFTSLLKSDHAALKCRKSIIDVVLHLRQHLAREGDALSYNKWLDIDYKLLARNAVLCGAYTTAMLFLELSIDNPVSDSQVQTNTEQLLYEIYSHIDEPDGFYGIKTEDLYQFLVRRFHHEGQWDKALQFHGAAVEANPKDRAGSDGLCQAFSSFGFNHLVMNTLHGSQSTNPVLDYRLGWRTELWDLPNRRDNISNASLYFSLRAVHRERNPHNCTSAIRKSTLRMMNKLRTLGSEDMTEIRESVQEVMCLREVKEWKQGRIQSRLKERELNILEWGDFYDINEGFEFANLEAIMMTRISLIHSVKQKEEKQRIGSMVTPFGQGLNDLENKCLIRLSRAARNAGQTQIALNSVLRAQRLESQTSVEVSEEFANVLWEQKEQKAAIHYLQNLVEVFAQKNDRKQSIHHALLLARLGSWVATACLEKPTEIWNRYLQPAILELDAISLQEVNSLKSRATIYHECAMFAERQYHAVIKSPDAIRWRVYMDRKRQEIDDREKELANPSNMTRRESLKLLQDTAKMLLKEDSEQYRKYTSTLADFLKQAVDMYARSLEIADLYDEDASIRFCSLWFKNFEGEAEFQKAIGISLSRIPSHKMVFLAHQLTARLSYPFGERLPQSQENLQSLVLRMCQEHPFHSLYQLYCLLPDKNVSITSRRQSGHHSTSSTQTERGIATTTVFDRLRSDEKVKDKVSDVENLCNACLQWAKYPFSRTPTYLQRNKRQWDFQVPSQMLICRINNLRVPVMTVHTPLDRAMRYDNCVWIDSFERSFTIIGGINLPKVYICKGSDGQKYRQLFKGEGKDDLRQDAVMEQVFDVVNSVLRKDRETKRRNLKVRGYKVIPLDKQAGLLEFVTSTKPLREWLMKAHATYRRNDMKPTEVGERHKRAQTAYKVDRDAGKLLETFHLIRSRVRPVMRHYFTEKTTSPMTWFAMRLNYTRSVATSSIVGHMIGLGDRHSSNILLDTETGEVVHIDLGVAFDQGKLLGVPETVPFRMTEDMVDGMGSSGTQGVFQRCAEETLRVLRSDSDVIMTVLEVFKHDPLHSWTLSDSKVNQVQQQSSTAHNTYSDHARIMGGIGIDMTSNTSEEAADRALSAVARKLDKSLSVEYTVNELIAEATDPFNLAMIFTGWMPHF